MSEAPREAPAPWPAHAGQRLAAFRAVQTVRSRGIPLFRNFVVLVYARIEANVLPPL